MQMKFPVMCMVFGVISSNTILLPWGPQAEHVLSEVVKPCSCRYAIHLALRLSTLPYQPEELGLALRVHRPHLTSGFPAHLTATPSTFLYGAWWNKTPTDLGATWRSSWRPGSPGLSGAYARREWWRLSLKPKVSLLSEIDRTSHEDKLTQLWWIYLQKIKPLCCFLPDSNFGSLIATTGHVLTSHSLLLELLPLVQSLEKAGHKWPQTAFPAHCQPHSQSSGRGALSSRCGGAVLIKK